MRRALDARDRGCRFPACHLRFTDAHHVRHWADGGETRLRNLVLLCRRHHRRVHEDGYRVCMDRESQVVFFTPRGRALAGAPAPLAPPAEPAPAPAEELIAANRERGVRPDYRSGMPRYRRDRDVPWEVEAAAWEVLDSEAA